MRERRIASAVPGEELRSGDSRPMFARVAGSRDGGGTIACHPASSTQGKPNGKEEEEMEGEAKPAATAEESVSGVRKMLLNPAEEALDSARQAAELILKDALDALHRTKQRLLEILPHSAASATAKTSEDAGQAVDSSEVSSSNVPELEKQENEKPEQNITSIATAKVATEPVMGFFRPFRRRHLSNVASAAAEAPILARL